MGLTLVTAATSAPVTVAEITKELYAWAESEDNVATLQAKIHEATEWFQAQTCRQFIQATYKQTFDCWFATRVLKIDLQPVYSVSSVKYYDADGTLQTISSTNYWADTSGYPPRIVFKPSYALPNLEDGRPSSVEVNFVAGYANAAAVPYLAKQGIKMLASYWYTMREAATTPDNAEPSGYTGSQFKEIPFGVYSIANALSAGGYT